MWTSCLLAVVNLTSKWISLDRYDSCTAFDVDSLKTYKFIFYENDVLKYLFVFTQCLYVFGFQKNMCVVNIKWTIRKCGPAFILYVYCMYTNVDEFIVCSPPGLVHEIPAIKYSHKIPKSYMSIYVYCMCLRYKHAPLGNPWTTISILASVYDQNII